MQESEVHSVLLEIVSLETQITSKENRLRSLAATLSRKIHLQRTSYYQEEGIVIMKKLLKTTDPLHCPRGEKTLFHTREDEIEHFFK
jgi:DNA mismatch repair ATPase MutL